jgi:hypothetical protein
VGAKAPPYQPTRPSKPQLTAQVRVCAPFRRLRSRRWRLAVAASLAGATLILVGALKPGQLTSLPLANPLALPG